MWDWVEYVTKHVSLGAMIFYIFAKWQVCASICPVLAPEIKIILMSFWVFRILLQQIKGTSFSGTHFGKRSLCPKSQKTSRILLSFFGPRSIWEQFT